MKSTFTINAIARSDIGKGASRRLRRANKVPGIVYGANKTPTTIAIDHQALLQLLAHESFYTKILDLDVNGNKEQVVLRDLQRHPFKPRILHFDLQRISATEQIIMRIPFHFIGENSAPGVKIAGGIVSHLMTEVEVRCLPKDLPEFIEVNLSKLEVNQTIHLSDLKLPKEVEIVALTYGEDKPIATVYVPRAVVEEETAPVATEVPVAGEEQGEEGAAAGTKAEGAEAKSKGKEKEK